MIIQDRAYISYDKLNEQCLRAVDIIERHRGKYAVIDSHRRTLLPVIDRYSKRQEQLPILTTQATEAHQESIEEAKVLSRSLRAWFGQLNLVVAGVDSRDFACDAESPESVIGVAESMIDFVTLHQAQAAGAAAGAADGESGAVGESGCEGEQAGIVFAEQLLEDLTRQKTAVYQKWSIAQKRLATEQEHRSNIRASAIEVQNALVSLRKTLRNTLGTRHRDYQKLRLNRGKRDELKDAEQLESITSTGDNDSSYAGGIDAVESIPMAAASEPTSTDGGNGRGAVAGIDPYFTPTNQADRATGSGT